MFENFYASKRKEKKDMVVMRKQNADKIFDMKMRDTLKKSEQKIDKAYGFL
eukprot:CAMPEP_0116870888 /NCGR_PEP_ID=MMETSP0463-20121206/1005_1 /TAXON_ID=181622 /ORGANISM="Strombidinopsis sp, Strain SopsisLIS2011" /LENGTH=50 /DNA_ID=CAMNT_0004508293 /DNA_START=28 /DNA_END=180 /DNA_ORIENTATION=-